MITTLKRELLIALALLAVGLVLLPPAIYAVGQQLLGPYESDSGLTGLMDAIWVDLTTGAAHAWLLVLSPYVVIQIARLGLSVARGRRTRDLNHNSGH